MTVAFFQGKHLSSDWEGSMKTLGGLLIAMLISASLSAQMSRNFSSEDLLQDDHVLDAYSLGRIVFVYRRSSLPSPETAVTDLSKLISVDRAAEHGKPDQLMLRQLNSPLMGIELKPELNEATAVNCGDRGFFWRILWEFYPAKGGSSGPPLTCRTYVGPDGSLIPVERALCDMIEFPNEDDGGDCLVSSLPFKKLSKRAKERAVIHGDEVLSRAQTKLDEALANSGREHKLSLRFRDQELINVPYKLLHTGETEERDIWAVHYVLPDLQHDAILKSDPFTVWVTVDGEVGKLTWNGWKLTE